MEMRNPLKSAESKTEAWIIGSMVILLASAFVILLCLLNASAEVSEKKDAEERFLTTLIGEVRDEVIMSENPESALKNRDYRKFVKSSSPEEIVYKSPDFVAFKIVNTSRDYYLVKVVRKNGEYRVEWEQGWGWDWRIF